MEKNINRFWFINISEYHHRETGLILVSSFQNLPAFRQQLKNDLLQTLKRNCRGSTPIIDFLWTWAYLYLSMSKSEFIASNFISQWSQTFFKALSFFFSLFFFQLSNPNARELLLYPDGFLCKQNLIGFEILSTTLNFRTQFLVDVWCTEQNLTNPERKSIY